MLKSFLRHPRSLAWRRALFQIHLWTGVAVGLYIVAISISGSVLVFQRELMNDAPSLSSGPVVPSAFTYGQLVRKAQRDDTGMALQSIDMRSSGRRLVTLTFLVRNRQRLFYLDRYTGRILGDEDVKACHPVLVWLEQLHNELLGGTAGATVNGIGALLLVVLCCTGIVIWWPGVRAWRRGLIVKWRAGWRRVNYDLHGAVGFWTLAIVFMWGATGAYFIFPGSIQKPLHLFAVPANSRQSHWKPGDRMASIDAGLAAAKHEFPSDKLAYLYMDVFRPSGQVAVFLSPDPSVPLTLREDIVHLDPGTAQVLWTESSERWSPVERLLMAAYSIHFGDFGGLPLKCVWCALGLSLAVLTVTGYLIWWNRVLRKKWPFG